MAAIAANSDFSIFPSAMERTNSDFKWHSFARFPFEEKKLNIPIVVILNCLCKNRYLLLHDRPPPLNCVKYVFKHVFSKKTETKRLRGYGFCDLSIGLNFNIVGVVIEILAEQNLDFEILILSFFERGNFGWGGHNVLNLG